MTVVAHAFSSNTEARTTTVLFLVIMVEPPGESCNFALLFTTSSAKVSSAVSTGFGGLPFYLFPASGRLP